jgi:hypothetical protein
MGLNADLTLQFKSAALSIFDNMVSSDILGYVFLPNVIDPITQIVAPGECQAVRSIVIEITRDRFNTGQGDFYDVGDTVCYIVYDEVGFVIRPGSEFGLPFDPDLLLIDPNSNCFPVEGPIVAGDSTLSPADFVISGDSTSILPIDSVSMSMKRYTIDNIKVDAAEAAYTFLIRLK